MTKKTTWMNQDQGYTIKTNSPSVIETSARREYMFDLDTKFFRERVIFVCGYINTEVACMIIQQLICLANTDGESNIKMVIISGGGSISAILAIVDTMNAISCKVETIGMGTVVYPTILILISGAPGLRFAYTHCRMIPYYIFGRATGTFSDILIRTKEMFAQKEMTFSIMQKRTKIKDKKQIESMFHNERWLSTQESIESGFIDEEVRTQKPKDVAEHYQYDSKQFSLGGHDIELTERTEKIYINDGRGDE